MAARAAIDWSWRDRRIESLALINWGPTKIAKAVGVARSTLVYRLEVLRLRTPPPSRAKRRVQ